MTALVAVGAATVVAGTGVAAAAPAPRPDPPGYWLVASDGGVYQFGTTNYGSMRGHRLAQPVVGATAAPNGLGYWLVARDGGIFTFGQAGYFGSLGGIRLNAPIVGMAADPKTGGYWMVGSDGGIFSFHAPFYGSTGNVRLNRPIVGMAVTPDGGGYWLVASDGGVFSFGDARFWGSTGNVRLARPVVGMSVDPVTGGYWLVASDGGIFAFHAPFWGSTGNVHLFRPIIGMGSTGNGGGYWLAASDGGLFTFGDAPYLGSTGGDPGPAPIVAIAATANGYPFPPGGVGYDVSQYQCGHSLPARDFGIVQVSDGSIDSAGPNPCYVAEARWAGVDMTGYIFMDGYFGGKPPPGPDSYCATYNLGCTDFDFGWAWVRHWITYSRSVGVNPTLWWLDVETDGKWTPNLAANADVIKGAVAGVSSMGDQAGIYSTWYQWPRVAGGTEFPGVPLWVPGASTEANAASFCANPGQQFAGGVVTLIQFGYGVNPRPPIDPDYACR